MSSQIYGGQTPDCVWRITYYISVREESVRKQKRNADLRSLRIALAALNRLGYGPDKLKIPIYAVPCILNEIGIGDARPTGIVGFHCIYL